MSGNKKKIVVSATYTSEPIENVFKYFLSELNITDDIQFAQYNQVLQQLLNPTSLFARNKNGINIILIRFDDWYRFASKTIGVDIKKQLIEQNAKEMIETLKKSVVASSAQYLLCICPSSPKEEEDLKEEFKEIEGNFEKELSDIGNLDIIKYDEIDEMYRVKDYYDDHTNRIAHIPYKEEFFTSLATVLARKVYSYVSKPYKVIAVDCDNTLWKGICGESTLDELQITEGYAKLQRFLEKKKSEGILVCICSKNNEEDVYNVFDNHKDMILKRDSIVSWHCNWEHKSENIKKLSKELGLGLDSIVFIDDNSIECEEVREQCPQVLVLQIPTNETDINKFVDNIWALDTRKVTKEDKERTKFYQQNIERNQLMDNSSSYVDFIKGLNLKLEFQEGSSSNYTRIAQLTQRTNQFNFTSIRRSPAEIEHLCNSKDYKCFVISAKDRFGDYGMVGVLILKVNKDNVEIDTFCLSCRALGRNVEHKMIQYTLDYAKTIGIENVKVKFIISEKNAPAYKFINSVCKNVERKDDCYIYSFKNNDDIKLNNGNSDENADSTKKDEKEVKKPINKNKQVNFLSHIVEKLNDLNKITNEVKSKERAKLSKSTSEKKVYTPMYSELIDIWTECLNIPNIQVNDEFFALGGTSLLLIRVLSKVRSSFKVEVPLITVFEADFTIESLAKEIVYQKIKGLKIETIKEKIEKVNNLTETEMLGLLTNNKDKEVQNNEMCNI